MSRRLVLLGFLILAARAEGDEFFLHGGGRLTGDVVERDATSIVVDVGSGQIGVPLSHVERIVPGTTPQGLYRERAAALAPDDVAGWLQLGQWARSQDLPTKAREAFELVLSLDPANATAHLGLGHVLLDDQWMTLEESYRARGYVAYQGTWVTPEQRRALLDERRAAAEEERDRPEAEARVREAEARARIAEAEAERAEAERDRAAAEATAFSYPAFVIVGGVSPGFDFHPRGHRTRCAFDDCDNAFTPRFVQPFRRARLSPRASDRRGIDRPIPHPEYRRAGRSR